MTVVSLPFDAITEVPALSLLGNNTGGTTDNKALTTEQVRALLEVPTFTEVAGLIPSLPDFDPNTIAGRAAGIAGQLQQLTPTQVKDLLGLGTADTPQFAGVNIAGQAQLTSPSAGTIAATTNGTTLGTVQAATFTASGTAATTIGNATGGVTNPGKLSINHAPTSAQLALQVNASSLDGMYLYNQNGTLVSDFGSDGSGNLRWRFRNSAGATVATVNGNGAFPAFEAATFGNGTTGVTTIGNATGGVILPGNISWDGANKQRLNAGAWESYDATAGWLQGMRQEATAAGLKMGAYGNTPVLRPVIDTATATLSTLLTALSNIGWIETV